jgi:uncharacterized membrane protein
MKTLMIAGLVLTLLGALVLAWRDLRGGAGKKGTGKKVVWDDLPKGIPRTREAWIGFPLIALGTLLQIIAVAAD